MARARLLGLGALAALAIAVVYVAFSVRILFGVFTLGLLLLIFEALRTRNRDLE